VEILFHLDKYMFALLEGSGFTIILLLSILKIIAKYTKWSADDKIINMLLGMVRTTKKPNP